MRSIVLDAAVISAAAWEAFDRSSVAEAARDAYHVPYPSRCRLAIR